MWPVSYWLWFVSSYKLQFLKTSPDMLHLTTSNYVLLSSCHFEKKSILFYEFKKKNSVKKQKSWLGFFCRKDKEYILTKHAKHVPYRYWQRTKNMSFHCQTDIPFNCLKMNKKGIIEKGRAKKQNGFIAWYIP